MAAIEMPAAEAWERHEAGECVLLPLAEMAWLFASSPDRMMAAGLETYLDTGDGTVLVALGDLLAWMVRTGRRTAKVGAA